MSKALAFDNGVPIYHGEAELLEEYIDRVETIQQTWTQDVEKKMGPLGPKIYNGLRGDAYRAAKTAGVQKADLATEEGLKKILLAVIGNIRQAAPVRVGELFMDYFDETGHGIRRPGEAVAQWLTRRVNLKNQMCEADGTTKISPNLEAYFLLKLCRLSKAQRAQLLASCQNVYEPDKLADAMRVQFGDIHLSERREKPKWAHYASESRQRSLSEYLRNEESHDGEENADMAEEFEDDEAYDSDEEGEHPQRRLRPAQGRARRDQRHPGP